MIGYQNKEIWHLFPYCRGFFGEKGEIPEGARVCRICEKTKNRLDRGRQVVLMHDQGLSYEDIAELEGISRQAIHRLASVYREYKQTGLEVLDESS